MRHTRSGCWRNEGGAAHGARLAPADGVQRQCRLPCSTAASRLPGSRICFNCFIHTQLPRTAPPRSPFVVRAKREPQASSSGGCVTAGFMMAGTSSHRRHARAVCRDANGSPLVGARLLHHVDKCCKGGGASAPAPRSTTSAVLPPRAVLPPLRRPAPYYHRAAAAQRVAPRRRVSPPHPRHAARRLRRGSRVAEALGHILWYMSLRECPLPNITATRAEMKSVA